MLIRTKSTLLSLASALAVLLLLVTCSIAGYQMITLNDRLNTVSGTLNDLRIADDLAAEAIAFPSERVTYQWKRKLEDLSERLGSLFSAMNTPEGVESEIRGRLDAIDRTVDRLGTLDRTGDQEVRRALTTRVNANRNALYGAVEGIQQQLIDRRKSLVVTTVVILIAGIVLTGLALLWVSVTLQYTVQKTLDDVGKSLAMLRPNNRTRAIKSERTDEVGEFIERLEELRVEVVNAFEIEQNARREADELNSAKTAFVTTTSHELRTPLNGLLGSLTFLNRTPLTPEQQRYLRMAQTSGDALLAIINNVLDISKIESGKLEIDSLPFSPRMAVDEVYSGFVANAQRKGLSLDVDFRPDQGLALLGDATRIKQILTNLVGNAIKFTKAGGVTVTIDTDPAPDDDKVCMTIDVKDTGPGIPKEKLNTIFQSFEQANTSITREFGGTGLGLTISRHLAAAMGGEITVKSEAGLGSIFTFRVTLPTTTLNTQKRKFGSSGDSKVKALAGIRILHADDVEINRVITAEMLRSWGCSVELVENGREAVTRATAKSFDVILMDIQMPILDGLEATRRLRANGYEAPVIGLTANAFEEQRSFYLDAGMNDVVSKPVNWDRLFSVVAFAVGASETDTDAVSADSEETPDDGQEPPVIDVAVLEHLTGIMPKDRIRTLADKALHEVSKTIKEIGASEDLPTIQRASHSMKGMCSNIGFKDLAEAFRQIEAEESIDRVPSYLDGLDRTYTATKRDYANWISQGSENKSDSIPAGPISGSVH